VPRKLKKSRPSAPAAGSAPKPPPSKPGSHPKLWFFRLAALTVLPILLLLCLELGLRLFGVGYPTSFFLKRQVAGRTVLTENDKFGWRFFGPALARTPRPIELPVSKPPQTCRVFVFGESAAYGDPKPEFGLPRMLEVLLRDRFPTAKIEVVNVAMTGINSNVVLPIANDCAGKQGDIWVIYMGNNEVVGPFGSGTVFGRQTPDLAMIRGSIALRGTRIGQLLTGSLERLKKVSAEQGEWQGMAMFINNQIRHDDPRMDRVYSHFHQNLTDIIQSGRKQGAHVVVSTVPSNLRDCAPFGSLHRRDLSLADLTNWDAAFQRGVQFEAAGDLANAVEQFKIAAALDDHHAELHFRWAQCLLALGQPSQAAPHFVQARDYDTLRFRADSHLNNIVRETVTTLADQNVQLYDAEADFAQSSPQNIPGASLFYEHVHLTFEGNYRLARMLAEQIARLLPEKLKPTSPSASWLTQTECARRLAWTGWDQFRAVSSLMVRLNEPPFTSQCDHSTRYAAVRKRLEELLPEQRSPRLQQARQQYEQAISLAPDDWVLQRGFANLLAKLGDATAAEAAMRKSVELLPHDATGHLELGLFLLQARRPAEASAEFQEVLGHDARSVPALNGLALAENGLGHPDDAIATLKKALRLRPGSADTSLNLGTALEVAGQKSQALEYFRSALHEHLGTPDLMVRLGKICMVQGWGDEGVTNFEKAVSFDPVNPATHWYLGGALDTKGRYADALQQFFEAVRLDPEFASGHLSLGIELSRLGKEAEAADAFVNALTVDPKLLDARLRLGVSLARQRKLTEARTQFEQVLQLQPTNNTARKYLQSILNAPQASP
jgi:tetratricopeptide (TPR) repeat protein